MREILLEDFSTRVEIIYDGYGDMMQIWQDGQLVNSIHMDNMSAGRYANAEQVLREIFEPDVAGDILGDLYENY